MKDIIIWTTVAVLCIVLVLYILYLRHKESMDRLISRFVKWIVVGKYTLAAIFFGAGFYVFAQSEPDLFSAWKRNPSGVAMCGVVSIYALVMAIMYALRPEQPDMASADDARETAIRFPRWIAVVGYIFVALLLAAAFVAYTQTRSGEHLWISLIVSGFGCVVFIVQAVKRAVSSEVPPKPDDDAVDSSHVG